MGFITFIVIIIPMFFIHRNDKNALVFMISALKNPIGYKVGHAANRNIVIVDEYAKNIFDTQN